MQDVKDQYAEDDDDMAEKIRICEEHRTALTGRVRPELTEPDTRRLAQKGKALNGFLPASVELPVTHHQALFLFSCCFFVFR